MLLNTRHFGVIEVNEEDIIQFPEGIPGFEDTKEFVLLGDTQDKDSPFKWLQGIDNPQLAFVIIDPKAFKHDYNPELPSSEIEILDIKDRNKVLIYSIVVIPDDISKMTANLKAPIVINAENNKGKQVLLDNPEYRVKHLILEELRKAGV